MATNILRSKRVVVTGMGAVTPLGAGVLPTWEGILSGRVGVRTIDRFNIEDFPSRIAGLVPQTGENCFDPLEWVRKRDLKRMDPFIIYAVAAAQQAVEDSGVLDCPELDYDRVGVSIGSGIGGLQSIENTVLAVHNQGVRKVSPFAIPSSLINLAAAHIGIRFNFRGPQHAVATACSSGLHAICEGVRDILAGVSPVVICGASEAPITPMGMASFAACRALSTHYNDAPESASRPWDSQRDGFVMGEGAGVIVLEEYDHAKRRGAKIYAEILGFASGSDASHITSPDQEGNGAMRAMEGALRSANIAPSKVDYINAHATSTPLGDAVELLAVSRVFQDRSANFCISSLKGAMGHLLGASGSVEFILTVLALQEQIAPPTINLHDPIHAYGMDLVPNQPQPRNLKIAMSNSFGFGGVNASVIIGRL